VATPQTRYFPLKEPDARNPFFFHNSRFIFRAVVMSGATSMTPFKKKNKTTTYLINPSFVAYPHHDNHIKIKF